MAYSTNRVRLAKVILECGTYHRDGAASYARCGNVVLVFQNDDVYLVSYKPVEGWEEYRCPGHTEWGHLFSPVVANYLREKLREVHGVLV